MKYNSQFVNRFQQVSNLQNNQIRQYKKQNICGFKSIRDISPEKQIYACSSSAMYLISQKMHSHRKDCQKIDHL